MGWQERAVVFPLARPMNSMDGEPTERGGDLKELVRLAGDGQGRQHRSTSNMQVVLGLSCGLEGHN